MRVFLGEYPKDGGDRIEEIEIHDYDVWSMDFTLAPIILPMLKILKEKKLGSPHVDDADVPEELRKTEDEPEDRIHDRWNWVLDEMIWTFEQKARDDWELDYFECEDDPDAEFGFRVTKRDKEGLEKHQARMSHGFLLFGKYFENLWI